MPKYPLFNVHGIISWKESGITRTHSGSVLSPNHAVIFKTKFSATYEFDSAYGINAWSFVTK